MRVKLLAVLMALGLALSPLSISAQTPDFKATQAAADQGDAEAQYSLGQLYYNGEGVAKNDVMAFKYYQLAADQGDAGAQYILGIMFARGDGVAKNDVIAYKWALLAQAQVSQIKELVDALELKLTPEQRAQGKALADAFKPKTREESKVLTD
jgi:TPR repeat protein